MSSSPSTERPFRVPLRRDRKTLDQSPDPRRVATCSNTNLDFMQSCQDSAVVACCCDAAARLAGSRSQASKELLTDNVPHIVPHESSSSMATDVEHGGASSHDREKACLEVRTLSWLGGDFNISYPKIANKNAGRDSLQTTFMSTAWGTQWYVHQGLLTVKLNASHADDHDIQLEDRSAKVKALRQELYF